MSHINCQFVLVGTSHPGNIGAAARAMKNMGLADLALVDPCDYKNDECYARASGADDLVDAALVYADLASAVADSNVVIGTSARLRTLAWPQLSPGEAANRIVGLSEGRTSVVFGRERSGLSNEELALCSALLVIPTVEDFSSLNVAAAVQVVGYEIRRTSLAAGSPVDAGVSQELPAEQADLERFYTHLFGVMEEVGYLDPDNPRLLLPRIRRLFNRSASSRSELQLLRGFLSAIQKQNKVN